MFVTSLRRGLGLLHGGRAPGSYAPRFHRGYRDWEDWD
jgi:hypothetical protein